MREPAKARTILHLEDDPALAKLVRLAFESFGFRGRILPAQGVAEARALLAARERDRNPLDLILVDMQLPDGTGLDLLGTVKSSPFWQLTPVIVLSAEDDARRVNEAYALGANCYLPKQAGGRGVIEVIRSLYLCWLDSALLPRMPAYDPAEAALARAVHLRARTSDFYLELARASTDEEQAEFWLDRALVEGNMSNLLVFLRSQLGGKTVAPAAPVRLDEMQNAVEACLEAAVAHLRKASAPAPAEACRWALDVVDAWDEEVLAEGFAALFLLDPALARALKVRAVGQMTALADFVRERSEEPELRRRADGLLAMAGRLTRPGNQTP